MAAVEQPVPPSQSWAAWLLDSYASSISPVNSQHDDDSDSHHTYTTSPVHTPMSSISNSSAYGPYVRTGRGGAGNFTWQSDDKSSKSPTMVDIEAQKEPVQPSSLSERRTAAANLENINTQEAMRLRQSSAHYFPSGRGGAGNFISSSEVAQAKRSPSLPVSLTGVKTNSPIYPVHPGRGGAGNYAASAEASGRKTTDKDRQEKIEAEQRREQVVCEVDGLLQPPPGAWLGGRRRSEAMHDEV
ncbi:hypothetical protein PV10_08218 [Exophiala mesophila]|uniref:Uncharacterized protein n=1 Tax=Exophiala mesophila TaxID=212818 RepID=A0A0D1ZP73_EXOME|nr:uncharacterized protein PV10_08218 [Exophiala mesophila]KIV88543.1 hypothetical protein PV10_08218 [Exophiala mesophila]